MPESVVAVVGSRKLSGPGWELTLERPVEQLPAGAFAPEGGWTAVLGLRRGLKLLVTGYQGAPSVTAEAWAGEPGDATDGVAVISLAGAGLAVARVPLCSCGDRGCGNSGVQLSKFVTSAQLPELAELLRSLPWTGNIPTRATVLRGNALAALPDE